MNAFSRTTRSLASEGSRQWTVAMLGGFVVLVAWAVWLLFATVPIYEQSQHARLEVESAAHPISAAVEGRLVSLALAIGQEVKQGDLLAEIDAVPEQAAMAESQARRSLLSARIRALDDAARREAAVLQSQTSAARLAVDEARAQAREASAYAKLAEDELKRLSTLRAGGAVTEAELGRARADADAKRESAAALTLAADRTAADRRVQDDDRRARIADLERQSVDAKGELAVEVARVRQLEYNGELRRVRAPVSGRVADVAALTIGAIVHTGDTLGSVVPSGLVRTVAFFPPTALGRLKAGQPARIRLDGFPWPAYGRLRGRTLRVAREPRDGSVRVELALDDAAAAPMPLDHGLPGTVEIEVERTSPLQLVLRAAGKPLSARGAPDAPPKVARR